ncbi:hypothetical protein FRC02_006513 [Tulasnella sp. 418]|nr:hypothetical protein FRC02_006513 [Tulasnella sp. 418]
MLWLRNGFSIEGWDPSYLFPNVETLYFTGRELHHLVKNRHLKAVYLAKDDTYNMKHTEEAILYLSGMGSTLLALDLSETRFIQETRWTSQLMHLLRYLPLLRYLGLPLFGPQTEKEDDFLRSCPKTLLICRLHYNALPPTLPQVTLRLFAALESLKWIIITSADDDLTHDTNKDINTGVFTREFPSGGYTDKSELRSVFRDLGIGLEPWDDKLMNFGEFLR